jgi:hypothetical protein
MRIKLLDIMREALEDEVLGKEPLVPLSDTDKLVAKAAVGTGDGSDVVSSKKISIPCYKLKPSQREIVIEKTLGFALNTKPCGGKWDVGGDLGAIVSNDNFIMDGHHRWASTMLIDSNASMLVTQIDLDAKTLISVLNVITKGEFNRTGNNGKGDIKNFNGTNLLKLINNVIDGEHILDGGPNQYDSEKIIKHITNFGKGNYDKGLELLLSNADRVGTYDAKKLKGAPYRFDMPVIEADEIDDIAYKLKTGYYDLTEPYNPEVEKYIR